mgnify:CR=1 FL=1
MKWYYEQPVKIIFGDHKIQELWEYPKVCVNLQTDVR